MVRHWIRASFFQSECLHVIQIWSAFEIQNVLQQDHFYIQISLWYPGSQINLRGFR